MTLTFEYDLDRVKTNQATSTPIINVKVTCFESCSRDTHTYTHDRLGGLLYLDHQSDR